MAFVVPQRTVRLFPPTDLPGIEEGDWVEIPTVYTAGMRKRAMGEAMKVHVSGNGSRPEGIDVDAFAIKQALLHEIVVAWSDPAPVTPEALDKLPMAVADWIAEQFDDLVGQTARSEPEKKESEPSSPSSTAPTTPPPSPASSATSRKSAGSPNTASSATSGSTRTLT